MRRLSPPKISCNLNTFSLTGRSSAINFFLLLLFLFFVFFIVIIFILFGFIYYFCLFWFVLFINFIFIFFLLFLRLCGHQLCLPTSLSLVINVCVLWASRHPFASSWNSFFPYSVPVSLFFRVFIACAVYLFFFIFYFLFFLFLYFFH